MAFLVVVVMEFQHASPFERHAFDEAMLERKWTRYPRGRNAYCAAVRGCQSEGEAVAAVEAEIAEIVSETGLHDWEAVCYLPDDVARAS
jgi:hypothetical protein